jgi:Uma2 family endonuclease
MAMAEAYSISLSYRLPRWNPAWAVPDVPVPEAPSHDHAIDYLKSLLVAWAARMGAGHHVFRNIGLGWVPEEPRVGFDPDLAVVVGGDKVANNTGTLKLWLPEHGTTRLTIEVVSASHPYKDYVDTPERAAAAGIPELWIYDPLLVGPRTRGGPHLLQVWRSSERGFLRVHAGSGPAASVELGAWLHPTRHLGRGTPELRISDDEAGEQRWLTLLEMEALRAEAEALRAEAEARRADELAAEVAQLKAELERGRGKQ